MNDRTPPTSSLSAVLLNKELKEMEMSKTKHMGYKLERHDVVNGMTVEYNGHAVVIDDTYHDPFLGCAFVRIKDTRMKEMKNIPLSEVSPCIPEVAKLFMDAYRRSIVNSTFYYLVVFVSRDKKSLTEFFRNVYKTLNDREVTMCVDYVMEEIKRANLSDS